MQNITFFALIFFLQPLCFIFVFYSLVKHEILAFFASICFKNKCRIFMIENFKKFAKHNTKILQKKEIIDTCLDWIVPPPGQSMLPETRFPHLLNPPLWGSTTEIFKRLTLQGGLSSPSWWTWTLMLSIQSALLFSSLLLPSIPPASSPHPTSRRMLSCVQRFLVLLPLPCITLILICLLMLLGDLLRKEDLVAPSLMMGDVNTALNPQFRTWTLKKPHT